MLRPPRIHGRASGLWKLVPIAHPHLLPAGELIHECLRRMPPMGYQAMEDPLFPGVWKVQPEDYDGRGVVYLFHGEAAERMARSFARLKNSKNGQYLQIY